MADGVILHEEVLQHVYAFLQAHGYKNALLALQNESRVPYNTLEILQADDKGNGRERRNLTTPAGLEQAVLDGQWDTVLRTYVDTLLLPEEVMFDMYELIFEELLTLRGFVHAARALITNSPIFFSMKRSCNARYARLLQQLESRKNTVTDDAASHTNGPVPLHIQEKREAMLRVLQEAITWNSEPYDGVLPAALWRLKNCTTVNGNSNELFLDKRRRTESGVVSSSSPSSLLPSSTVFLHYPFQCPKHIKQKIVFANAEAPAACVYASLSMAENKQQNYGALIVGRTDGAVDFLDINSATPVGNSVGHNDGVLSITLDAVDDGVTWVAVGYRNGWVKIYNTATRKLLRRFSDVHGGGVTSVIFAGVRSVALFGHCSLVVSGSFDGTIQVLDIWEGRSIQRITDAHQSKYILSLCLVNSNIDGVVSAGNNGTLCFWKLYSDVGLQQAGPARALCSINASLKDELPTRLLHVDAAQTGRGGEVLVLTRGQRVLLLDVRFTEEAANPVVVLMRSNICTPRALYSGCTRVVHTPALRAPMLSVFFTDTEGTIMLYNVEMSWRVNEETNNEMTNEGDFCHVGLRPLDETSIVVVDFGKRVSDLSLVNVDGESNLLVAYSPSLSALYVLSWT